MMKNQLKAIRNGILQPVVERLEDAHVAIGRRESDRVRAECAGLQDAEFKVFSARGEDGIIQYLISRVPISDAVFVEIGVEDYRESNTRFLLQNNGWRGLILDCGRAHLAFLRSSSLARKYRIEGRSIFVTRDNVDAAIVGRGFVGDIGLLSIDIDGNDYWIFEAITSIKPRIIVAEYNSTFGARRALTIPYDPAFNRFHAHSSGLYFGASLPALCHLADRKGYRFVGSNSAGINAFFVREDVVGTLPQLRPEDGWVESVVRESRDHTGRLTYVDSHVDRLALIADLPIYDVEHQSTGTVRDALLKS